MADSTLLAMLTTISMLCAIMMAAFAWKINSDWSSFAKFFIDQWAGGFANMNGVEAAKIVKNRCEKIKQMELDEMAEWLYESKDCCYCIYDGMNCNDGMCRDGIRKWLETELENENFT